jgi:hypothetical protein
VFASKSVLLTTVMLMKIKVTINVKRFGCLQRNEVDFEGHEP